MVSDNCLSDSIRDVLKEHTQSLLICASDTKLLNFYWHYDYALQSYLLVNIDINSVCDSDLLINSSIP